LRTITHLLFASGLALGLATTSSADIAWTFNNVTFCLHCGQPTETDNNITAASFFTTDNAASTVTGWDITVAGTNAGADNEYKSGVAGNGFIFPDANHLDFFSPGFVQYLDLFLAAPGITSAGGPVNLLLGDAGATGSSTIACNGCSTLVSGSVTGSTSAVPEPRFGAFLAACLIGLGFIARRKLVAIPT
jgi:hypothetical protein